MFTICTIGCGWMSSTGHGPSLKKYANDHTGVVLAGCCDLDEDRAVAYREAFGFQKHYTDFRKMITECKPDVVSVIMPVPLTAQIATQVMEMGCNVIMEKPPGKNMDETLGLIRTAKKMGVSAHVSFNRRFFPVVTEMMRRIHNSGEKVDSVTCQMYRYNRPDADFSTTIVHAIDLIQFVSGSEFTHADMVYTPTPELGEGVKDIFMTCRFASGAVGMITAAPNTGAVIERLTVNTRNYTYFVNLPVWGNMDSPGSLIVVTKGGEIENIDGRTLCDSEELFETSGFYGSNCTFFDAIRAGQTLIDLDTAIDCVKLQDAVRDNLSVWDK